MLTGPNNSPPNPDIQQNIHDREYKHLQLGGEGQHQCSPLQPEKPRNLPDWNSRHTIAWHTKPTLDKRQWRRNHSVFRSRREIGRTEHTELHDWQPEERGEEEKWISGIHSQHEHRDQWTHHQHAVVDYVHLSSGLEVRIPQRTFIDTVCSQYLTEQAGK